MDSRLRPIRLTGKAAGHSTGRTRSGYYATPDAKTNKRRISNDPHPVASLARLPALPVAESVPALAHRDLLGAARRRDHVRAVLEFRVAAAARTGALPPLGGADELAACCCCFESGGNPPAP